MGQAWGITLGTRALLALAPAACLAQLAPPERAGHAYAVVGGGSASTGGGTGMRALQLAFGREVGERLRCDAFYVNEGHPSNNHRDGFGAQCWMARPAGNGLRVEVGAGPYVSMNATTSEGGTSLDDKRLGLVASAALLYPIGGSDTHLRVQYNHVAVSGAPRTNIVMVGLGMDFGGHRSAVPTYGRETEVGIWAGAAETSRQGQSAGTGWQIEARRPASNAMAYSVSALSESQSGMLDREGLAFQAWWRQPVTEQWEFSAGAGPMVARDRKRAGDQDKLLALISIEAARQIGTHTTASLRFNRIVSNYDRDADQFMLGLSRRF